MSDWSLLTAVLGMEGGTDGISLPEFVVAEIGVAFGDNLIPSSLCGITSRVCLRCLRFLL